MEKEESRLAGCGGGETALPGRSSNSGEDSPLCSPDVFHVGISDAGRAAVAS